MTHTAHREVVGSRTRRHILFQVYTAADALIHGYLSLVAKKGYFHENPTTDTYDALIGDIGQ